MVEDRAEPENGDPAQADDTQAGDTQAGETEAGTETEFGGDPDTGPDIGDADTAGIGPHLRAQRERRGLTLDQVAAETRIPRRHLETIEAGEFDTLPGRTYAVGFAKTYAKLLELDREEVARRVRSEFGDYAPGRRDRDTATFQPGDPARVPSAGLGWLSIAAVALLVVGLFFFMRILFTPAAELPSLTEQQAREQRLAAQQARQEEQAQDQAASASPAPTGPVVFTSLEEGIWVKFYDAEGRQLMQKLMAEGEDYTVPADAEGPQVWTGRPDALAITIGGESVPKLAEDDMIMRDIPVTAEALLARGEDEDGGEDADADESGGTDAAAT